ncbi:hypothetical protein FIU83_07715 [Halomonas sp. THAF5a]|uniref:hypothetical protein n=1 Tax=Halomonas sp. THAF5a TaxID=2587844 RepID=UPI00126928D6|nr:hypothetical protein [Halomonas sp. THAF5a]QFU01526.1 hypothetical protein FIU83_07715 [Halomonas sp. THAF5a]
MLKQCLGRMIGISGYELRRRPVSAVADLRSAEFPYTPMEALYACTSDRFVVDVPVDMIVPTRMMLAWITALRAYENRGEEAARTLLQEYFRYLQPVNVAQYLKLPARQEWHLGPPLSYVYPWEDMLPQVKMDFRLHLMRDEAIRNGLDWQESDGWKGFGPVSERLIDMELGRLTRTYDSIKRHGIDERHGHVVGTLFCAGNVQMVQPRRGWHRVAVCLAIGLTSIPVMFDRRHVVIRLEEAESWPNVRRGLFSLDEAVRVFDERFGTHLRRASSNESPPISSVMPT